MTIEHEAGSPKKFVPVILPWAVAAGAMVVYALTLNHWVSFNSLPSVAKLSGWNWQPELTGPLCWLLTCPLRALPAPELPVAVNLFSALCAVLTLALLARCVVLLPHNRTQDQREREQSQFSLLSIRAAWVPPVLAALVCGLQLTFWENATAGSGQINDLTLLPFANHCEMLDLLLFAYVTRCLLEFRVSNRQSWLSRAAFVYGLAMTGNYAMTGFLPVFLLALVWIKGFSFFNARFLGRMALWGVAGFSLFLLLPAAQGLTGAARMPFWPALKASLGLQKSALAAVYGYFSYSKHEALAVALTSLLPLFLIAIRWTSYFGDNSRLGIWVSTFTFRVVHAAFLAVCIWVALDPPFSPRNNLSLTCLPLSFLGALCVGYFSGYFLLVFGTRFRSSGRPSSTVPLPYKAATGAIWLLLPVVPALLLWRNLPQILVTNGPMLEHYAAAQAQALPPHGAVLLSDDTRRLALLHAFLARAGKGDEFLFLDTVAMRLPDYHRFLKKKYGDRWPVDVPKDADQTLVDRGILKLMARLAASNSIYYLHPSFGYYFEVFVPEAHGLVYKLSRYPTNTLLVPQPAKELVMENESFWAKADEGDFKLLVEAISTKGELPGPGFIQRLMSFAHLQKLSNRDAAMLAEFYSRALDFWGVEAQKAGELAQAAAHFRRALDLNPPSVTARINLGGNQNLRAGRKSVPLSGQAIEEMFGAYRKWETVINENGPFDEPAYCYQLGLVLAKNGLYRQAAQQFDRSRTLAPELLDPRLWLARLDVLEQLPDEALKVTEEIRSQREKLGLSQTNLPTLLLIEASAHLFKHDVKAAETVFRAALDKYPDDQNVLTTAARVYASYGVFSNAVVNLNAALAKHPDDEGLLIMGAQIYVNAKLFTNAVTCISNALAKDPADDPAREQLLGMAVQVHLNAGLYSNAVALVDQQLKLNPNNPQALVYKGYGVLQLGAFDQAAALLSQAMGMETNNSPALRAYAQFNRAVAYLRANKLDQAQHDYEALNKIYPAFQIYYGLQDIAYRKKDFPNAVKYCELYLTNAPPDTDEAKLVSARLKELKPGAR